jgi:hypothetical protein
LDETPEIIFMTYLQPLPAESKAAGNQFRLRELPPTDLGLVFS